MLFTGELVHKRGEDKEMVVQEVYVQPYNVLCVWWEGETRFSAVFDPYDLILVEEEE